jgi:uncharacterized protein YndB with AHSA1/START domain
MPNKARRHSEMAAAAASPARFTTSRRSVGGTHKISFTNFTTGQSHSFGASYVELVRQEVIRYTDKFDDPSAAVPAVTPHICVQELPAEMVALMLESVVARIVRARG